MKRVYLVSIILLLFASLATFTGNQTAFSAPISYGKSMVANHGTSAKIFKAEKIERPKLIGTEDIAISAGSYIVIDTDTMSPLLEKNSNKKTLIASITKLMTAVITLENSKLDDVVEIKSSFADIPAGKMGLFYGEKITVENLLSGLLISSSNDAAAALSTYISKGNDKKFLEMMDAKAKEIGMINTNFTNPIGLDNDQNYSTPQDLVYLASYALKNKTIANLVQQKEKRIMAEDDKTSYYLQATNSLLGDKDVKVLGIKTGSTPAAGGCLLALAELNPKGAPSGKGHKILTVVLGSPDRFGETKKLIQWTEENINWK